jgi:arylsulfatase A
MMARLRLAAAALLLIPIVLVSFVIHAGDRSAELQTPTSATAIPPNIVVILADDLGYGDLASYGHPNIRTPRLDRLAAEGLRLTSYYSGAPSCTPARAALMTGRYAIRAGLPAVLGPEAKHGLPASEITLAEALRARGYRTHAIGKWHLGHASEAMLPTGNGFDGWFGLLYSNDMIPPWVQTTKPLQLYRDAKPLDEPVNQDDLTTRYTEEAVRFIERSAKAENGAAARPFFLYLAHSMPHLPLGAPARFRGQSRAGLYGDVIEMLDWSAGEVLDALARTGAADRTIVVFTSDNGPWANLPARMLQKGIQRWDAGTAGLLRDSKATTYEGGLRVPAIVRWPGRIPAARVSDTIATAMDLHVTLLQAAGAEAPRDRPMDGQDLLPLLSTASAASAREFFYFNNAALEGVRVGPWKLRRASAAGASTEPELFNLDVDPGERFNRAKDEPAIVERLDARLQAFASTLPASR